MFVKTCFLEKTNSAAVFICDNAKNAANIRRIFKDPVTL